ncbi:protein SIEVE ELEMENT OCCLUSION C [Euphorbia lathyris]|uniref:protein SIEVE ELEMENT OCCLUSION C n=1 Tax=Euphorbia lathyris TaxID=212925 RepID=UPI003313DC44
MNLLHSSPSTSLEDEILIRKILLTHDPDGRHLDSELLLTAIENVLNYTAKFQINIDAISTNDISNIEIVGAEESLGQIITKISNALLFRSSSDGDLHERTMVLLDLLGNYRWDAKMVLVLAAFATNYGEFWLLMQLCPCNPLAESVALLRQFPNDLTMLKPRIKALSLLVKTLMDVTKCIIKFESLPFRHVKIYGQAMAAAKSAICLASYWVTRNTLACSSQITDLAMKPEQVCSTSAAAASASWQLISLVYRLSSVHNRLSQWVELCHQQIERKLYQKLINLFQEPHSDNQEVLEVLLALKDALPLQNSSMQPKVDLSELKDKIVILLVSKPDLLPLEGLFLLVQQTYDHPQHNKSDESYEIVWVPISFSDTWTHAEVEMFKLLSNSLPWYSLRRPWLLNSAVVTFIKQTWDFKDDPVMVVLDSQGNATNSNAIDMVLLWGAKAYPFSSSRENRLWEEAKWSMHFLLDEIHPLISRWVEEGRNICIYGSDNLDWIREFNAELKNIRSNGVQLETVYVGKSDMNEHVRCVLDVINEENHTSLHLPLTKLHLFWIRLRSMRRSMLKLVQSISSNHIYREVSALLDSTAEGWAVIGKGNTTEVVTLQGRKVIECLNKFSEWRENVAQLGFMGALRTAFEPPASTEPCNQSNVLPYAEELLEGIFLCEKCKRPMKKYVLYE